MADGEAEAPKYKLTLPDGSILARSRDYTGPGSAEYENGEKFNGNYKEGLRVGYGEYRYKNGDLYFGGFDESRKQGVGKAFYSARIPDVEPVEGEPAPQPGVYHGEFFDGLKQGEGSYKYVNGDVYSGEWLKGKKHGEGTYVFADKSQLRGAWANGWIVKGQWIVPGGAQWDGGFKWNKPNGQGAWVLENGVKVSGEFLQIVSADEEVDPAALPKEPANMKLQWLPHSGPLVDCD